MFLDPNIKGGLGSVRPIDSVLSHSGALSFAAQNGNVVASIQGTSELIPTGFLFNANNANNLYKNEITTVQVNSLRALTLIRAY